MTLNRLTSTRLLPRSEAAAEYRPATSRAAVAPIAAPGDATADRRRSRQEQSERREADAPGSDGDQERMRRNARELVALLARLGSDAGHLVRTDNLLPRWHAIDDEA